ncbi:AraC family transcriptional regulator [uncultured Desulfobacter sp.]|uniref:helix-turn-helix domain-containing protein n=1 Tax=uncultured Desulfobacter sp. TaxID=240139 RepID=UPI002AAA70F2|nr:AraC family transcriptional regulator [uncultured Desulfobacter sp.]
MLSQILIKDHKGNYVDFKAFMPEDESVYSNEVIRPLPRQKGRGHFSSFAICKGLDLGICRCRFDEDYMARFTLEKPFFTFGFCLKGQCFSQGSSMPYSVPMVPDRSSAYFFNDRFVERKIKGQQEVLALAIHISPDFLLKRICPDYIRPDHIRPGLMRDVQYGDLPENFPENRRFYADHIMTAQMKTAVYQILNNPHKGRVGNIYLESKALELIALRLEQVFRTDGFPGRNSTIDPEETERIYRARDLLVENRQFPPSLRELAGQAGMSHTQLNKGFKAMFGCTVFEYLRKERLAYARMLMEENPADLTWIAYESGFCSSSHFAASFLKAYGIRPSAYRKSLSIK